MSEAEFNFYFFAFIFALILGTLSGVVARKKGNGPWAGFWLGFLLGPLGLIIVAVFPSNVQALERDDPGLRKCPDCAEMVRSEARKCKHCGLVFQTRRADDDAATGEFDRAVAARRIFKP